MKVSIPARWQLSATGVLLVFHLPVAALIMLVLSVVLGDVVLIDESIRHDEPV